MPLLPPIVGLLATVIAVAMFVTITLQWRYLVLPRTAAGAVAPVMFDSKPLFDFTAASANHARLIDPPVRGIYTRLIGLDMLLAPNLGIALVYWIGQGALTSIHLPGGIGQAAAALALVGTLADLAENFLSLRALGLTSQQFDRSTARTMAIVTTVKFIGYGGGLLGALGLCLVQAFIPAAVA